MRFWDTSAVVPLLIAESTSDGILAVHESDRAMVVWWGTPIECTSAVSRVERDGALDTAGAADALDRLRQLGAAWVEVQPTEALRRLALRLLRVHALRAADALQLAAAVLVAEDVPHTVEFVSLDQRLKDAARREGLRVLDV